MAEMNGIASMSKLPKGTVYLGDGAYAVKQTPMDVQVFAWNGLEITNSVYLDIMAIAKLVHLMDMKVPSVMQETIVDVRTGKI
jgi:hypothetical protein